MSSPIPSYTLPRKSRSWSYLSASFRLASAFSCRRSKRILGRFWRGGREYGGFLKWWYPTTMGFPTTNDHFGVFWGYHHLRKHPYGLMCLEEINTFWCRIWKIIALKLNIFSKNKKLDIHHNLSFTWLWKNILLAISKGRPNRSGLIFAAHLLVAPQNPDGCFQK